MNEEFLYQFRLLLINCSIHYNENKSLINSSMIGMAVVNSTLKMISTELPINEKNGKDFLEMIVESHKDNPRVMEAILNKNIIAKSIDLYNQIMPQHVAK